MDALVTSFLSELRLGEPKHHERMTVYPLFGPTSAEPNYSTLKEALDHGHFVVTEVGEEGTVPELKVANNGDLAVLILDGEELIGAKQNRVVNTTMLIIEQKETIIPVTCTEQGRWGYNSPVFADSDIVMSPRIRSAKAAGVTASLRDTGRGMSDQADVWDEIDRLSEDADVVSPSSAMRDVYKAREKDLKAYMDACATEPLQSGLLVAVDGDVVGFDVLSRPEAFGVLAPKLVKSYALDAILAPTGKITETGGAKPKEFFETVKRATAQQYDSVGYGKDHRFTGEGLVGSALVHQECVIHMAFFRSESSSDGEPMSGSSQRRQFRMRRRDTD